MSAHDAASCAPWGPAPRINDGGESADRRAAHRAVAWSAGCLFVAGALELVVAAIGHSAGLLGDAFHNLADVGTSAIVFVGLRVSRRPATASHPYGWDRAEDLSGLGVALLIWASAALALVVSVRKLVDGTTASHVGAGVVAAAIAVAANLLVARYKLRVGRRIRSAALVADARHSWIDAASSAGALLGLAGVAAGLRWADAVAGLVIAGIVVHVAYDVTRDVVVRLVDGVAPETLEAATAAAGAVAGVSHVHAKGRWTGRALIVEVEGYVEPDTPVEACERIGDEVRRAVAEAVPETRVVTFSARALSRGG